MEFAVVKEPDPDDPKTKKADELFAPVMSPSWSKTSRHSQHHKDGEHKESFKDKLKGIFK